MKTIKPLHSRANVIPRVDIHTATNKFLHAGGEIDAGIFGKMRVGSSIQYTTPCRRNNFAFGEVMSMGLPDRERPRGVEVSAGDIIGFDLFQTGHELDAAPYYENAASFYTLPWKEILCKFAAGAPLPEPVGDFCMVEVDPIMTRRLVLSSAGSTLELPGSMRSGAATNKGKATKVKLVAGKFLAFGMHANRARAGAAELGDWALFNPMDGVDIDYTGGRNLTFVKWDEIEQLVADDRA